MTTGIEAINNFLTNQTPGFRLIIKKKEIHFVNRRQISFWSCLKAKFGRGNASMKKIAAFIHDNRNNLFPEEDKGVSIRNRKDFNKFLTKYNKNRIFTFKVAKKIGKIGAGTITFFGKEDWAKVGIYVKDAPPVPPNLKQIYTSPCPIWPGKTIGETHMVVLVPKMLGDKPTTINRLKKLGEKYFSDPLGYHIYDRILSDDDGHRHIKNSYWILMTKETLPWWDFKSDKKPLDAIPKGYECPSLIEANVCVLSQYLRGRTLTDKSNYLFHKEAIICSQKNIEGTHAIIGHCDEYGLSLVTATSSYNGSGVAALKKL